MTHVNLYSMQKAMRSIFAVAIVFISFTNAADEPVKISNASKPNIAASEAEILLWVKSTENVDDIAKQVERSLELSKTDTTPDKYISVTLLLAKAEYLRANSIAGGREIAQAAENQLREVADTTTVSGALKYAVLLSDIYKVKDQNSKAIETLEQCLQSYYPDIIKRPSVRPNYIPEPARISLQKLGILYKAEADAALDIDDKKKWFSLAAGCFISSACGYYNEKTRKPEPVPDELLTQISACSDAIHILGGQLRPPAFLQEKLPETNIGLIVQTMAQQNFKTALKLIERSPSGIQTDCSKIVCLAALNMKEQAIGFANTCASKYKDNADFVKTIAKAANAFEEHRELETSFKLYHIFAKLAPDDPQAPKVLIKYANYLKENEQTDKAMDLYIETARQYAKDLHIASLCYTNAAQLQAINRKYNSAIQTVEEFERLHNNDVQQPNDFNELFSNASYIAAKCSLQIALQKESPDAERRNNAAYAEKRLGALLKNVTPDSNIYPQIAILSVHAAELAHLPDIALAHYSIQLYNNQVTDQIKSATASRLLKMFISVKRDDLLFNLAEMMVDSSLPNKAEISLGCISQLLGSPGFKQVVPICLKWCEFDGMNKPELFALLEITAHPSLLPYKEQLLPAKLSLVEKYLPSIRRRINQCI